MLSYPIQLLDALRACHVPPAQEEPFFSPLSRTQPSTSALSCRITLLCERTRVQVLDMYPHMHQHKASTNSALTRREELFQKRMLTSARAVVLLRNVPQNRLAIWHIYRGNKTAMLQKEQGNKGRCALPRSILRIHNECVETRIGQLSRRMRVMMLG